VIGFFAAWLTFKKHDEENIPPRLERNSNNEKVKRMSHAKELLRKNASLLNLHSKLVTMYSNEEMCLKNERSKVITKIVNQTGDIETATAVCALARIEAKKRKERNNGKFV
jgi:hypothetical protein